MRKKSNGDHPFKKAFASFASSVAYFAGSPLAFSTALVSLIAWAVCGPLFGYSEAWQLVINTGTTIVTFMMVFVIQNSQNRDGMAIQIKLDELIRASGAKNSMIDLECLSEEELAELRVKFAEIADEARKDERHVEVAQNASTANRDLASPERSRCTPEKEPSGPGSRKFPGGPRQRTSGRSRVTLSAGTGSSRAGSAVTNVICSSNAKLGAPTSTLIAKNC